jgi:hypothetical protein
MKASTARSGGNVPRRHNFALLEWRSIFQPETAREKDARA